MIQADHVIFIFLGCQWRWILLIIEDAQNLYIAVKMICLSKAGKLVNHCLIDHPSCYRYEYYTVHAVNMENIY